MAIPKIIDRHLTLFLLMGRSGGVVEMESNPMDYVGLYYSLRTFVEQECGGAVCVSTVPLEGYKKVTLTKVGNRYVNAYRNVEVCASKAAELFGFGAKPPKSFVLYFRPSCRPYSD